MEQLRCQNCGEPLTKKGDTYVCAHCGFTFQDDFDVRAGMSVQSALDDERTETLYRAKRALFDATHAQFPSKDTVIAAARAVLSVNEEDPLALVYLHSHDRNPFKLIEVLGRLKTDPSIAEEILNWLLHPLNPRVEGSLIDFADRHFQNEKRTEWRTKIETEMARVDDGFYETSLSREVFLCYSSADMPRVIQVLNWLESNGFDCFAAFRNLRHGRGAAENYDAAIKEAMRSATAVVFLSSSHSRSFSCDALKVELTYMTQELADKPRVEYLLEDYGTDTPYRVIKALKAAFPSQEQCRDKQDLIDRIEACIAQAAKPKETAEDIRRKAEEEARKRYEEALEKERRLHQLELEERERRKEEAEKAHRLELEKAELERRLAEDARAAEERARKREEEDRIEAERREREARERRDYEDRDRYESHPSPSRSGLVAACPFCGAQAEFEFDNGDGSSTFRCKSCDNRFVTDADPITDDDILPPEEESADAPKSEPKKKKSSPAKGKGAKQAKLLASNPHIEEGRIVYGHYPQEQVFGDLIDELEPYAGTNGASVEHKGEVYLYWERAWYRYKPIRWRVFGMEGDEIRLISEDILDGHVFCPDGHFFDGSEIRKWLNDEFLKTAFPDEGKYLSVFPDLSSVSLLYKEELEDPEAKLMGSDRIADATQYAIARDIQYHFGAGAYWTRTRADSISDGAYCVDESGNFIETKEKEIGGVRPTIRIDASGDEDLKEFAAEELGIRIETKSSDRRSVKEKAAAKTIDILASAPIVDNGEVIYGQYPQTEITNSRIVKAVKDGKPDARGYVEYDGVLYCYDKTRKGVYKVEPIHWIPVASDGIDLELISDLVLDVEPFSSKGNFFDDDSVRSWLENSFFPKAFPDEGKSLSIFPDLKSISLVFKESLEDSIDFGDDVGCIAKGSDYALAVKSDGTNAKRGTMGYWTKTRGGTGCVCAVNQEGDFAEIPYGKRYGVRPAIRLSLFGDEEIKELADAL